MRTIKIIGILAVGFLLVRCTTSYSVLTDYDRDAEFADYTTFYWADEFQREHSKVDGEEPLFYNTLMKKRLKEAVQREMEGRGYTLSSENPDLLVNSQVMVENRISGSQNYNPGFYGSWWWMGGSSFNSNIDQAKEGDVVIDLIDREKKQLVWQGYAPGVLEVEMKNREETLKNAVTLIFSEYGRRAGEDRTAQVSK
ncbi:DUF4136 domain-containing protein [Tunicatimonas pelagia]|uniref:DUF4136 domain-containing protein n=1 Tax=Tunicatimonas pelagia TaxID=931531 RepID=UPI00266579A3|nr:DUF4136 domain-containing protein [Tunicatimonas pelagia]WKN40964.1 DUF4136 domain-containing protein [Tunicatimonas pelagia]